MSLLGTPKALKQYRRLMQAYRAVRREAEDVSCCGQLDPVTPARLHFQDSAPDKVIETFRRVYSISYNAFCRAREVAVVAETAGYTRHGVRNTCLLFRGYQS